MQPKNWFASKTNIAAILTILVSFLTWLQGEAWIAENPQAVAAIGIGFGVVMVILRGITVQPVKNPVKSLLRSE